MLSETHHEATSPKPQAIKQSASKMGSRSSHAQDRLRVPIPPRVPCDRLLPAQPAGRGEAR